MDEEKMVDALRTFDSECAAETDEELVQTFHSLRAEGAQMFGKMAIVVRHTDERGITERLAVPNDHIAALRKIGRGEILPEAYEQLGGTFLESKLGALSHEEQRALAAGGSVPLYTVKDGRTEMRQIPALQLTASEAGQVFGPGGIRNAGEQRSHAEAREKRHRQVVDGTFILDYVHQTLIVRQGKMETKIHRDKLFHFGVQLLEKES